MATLEKLVRTVEALKLQITTRDADLIAAEKRFEELAVKMQRLETDRSSADGSEAGFEKGDNKISGILKNQAFRNLATYDGDHKKFGTHGDQDKHR